jgi:hypothetical protein
MRGKGFLVLLAVASIFLSGLLLLESNIAESSHGTKFSVPRKQVYSDEDCTTPVEGSYSILDRTATELVMRIRTYDLEPGAYTNWFMLSGPGIEDPGGDGVLVARASGRIIRDRGDGRGSFKGILRVGEYVENGMDILNSGELVDPRSVDVTYIIRYHGEVVDEFRREQLTKFLGGCTDSGGPNTCTNVQWTCHDLVN